MQVGFHMQLEDKARIIIDKKLQESEWIVQDMRTINCSSKINVTVCELSDVKYRLRKVFSKTLSVMFDKAILSVMFIKILNLLAIGEVYDK